MDFLFYRKYVIRRLFVIFGIIPAIIVGLYSLSLSFDDIDYDKIRNYNPIVTSEIFDKDGNQVMKLGIENRVYVTLDKIPKNIINAFIAAEDKTFYTNHGIDILGFARAMLKNVKHLMTGNRFEGASTITQQVVRNVMIKNERTVSRKVKEMIYSYKLSQNMSKDEIMEVYLNHIYLGSKSYGVAAAVMSYFGKNLDEVTLEEAALIASLTKAPSKNDPRKNKDIIERRNWVISRMHEEEFITEEEAIDAIQKPIVLSNKIESRSKPYPFSDYMVNYLDKKGITSSDLAIKRYEIYSTLDTKLQNISQNALDEMIIEYEKKYGYSGAIHSFEKFDDNWLSDLKMLDLPAKYFINQVAIVKNIDPSGRYAEIQTDSRVIGKINISDIKWAVKRVVNEDGINMPKNHKNELKDISSIMRVGDILSVKSIGDGIYTLLPKPDLEGSIVAIHVPTGNVLSVVGGYGNIPGSFNRAFQAKRQSGSAIKPISYTAALENGFQLNDILMDSEIKITSSISGTVWEPKNHTRQYLGPMTVRMAFEKSLNSPLIRMLDHVGMAKVGQTFERFGLGINEEKNMSMALGALDTVTLFDMVRAYMSIFNLGKIIEPNPIMKIMQDNKGIKNLISLDKNGIIKEVNSENSEVSAILNESTFSETVARSTDELTAYQVLSLMIGSATRGTSSKIASSGQYIAGKTGTSNDAKDVWFIGGNNQIIIGCYLGYDTPRSLGNEFGSTLALPVVAKILSQISSDYPGSTWKMPEGIIIKKIDRYTGKFSNANNAVDEYFKSSDKLSSDLNQYEKYDSEETPYNAKNIDNDIY